jgi:hypothetical protein
LKRLICLASLIGADREILGLKELLELLAGVVFLIDAGGDFGDLQMLIFIRHVPELD